MPDATLDNEIPALLERCKTMAEENLLELEALLPCLSQQDDKNTINQAIYLSKSLIADIAITLEKLNGIKEPK